MKIQFMRLYNGFVNFDFSERIQISDFKPTETLNYPLKPNDRFARIDYPLYSI